MWSSASKISTALRIVTHFPGCCHKENSIRQLYGPHSHLERMRQGGRRVHFSQEVTVPLSDTNKSTVKIIVAKLLQEKLFSAPYLGDPYFEKRLSRVFLLPRECKHTCIQSLGGAVTMEVRMLRQLTIWLIFNSRRGL